MKIYGSISTIVLHGGLVEVVPWLFSGGISGCLYPTIGCHKSIFLDLGLELKRSERPCGWSCPQSHRFTYLPFPSVGVEVGWPESVPTPEARTMLVKELHLLKTALFNQAVVDGVIPLRKGVIRLIDEAIYNKVPLVRESERLYCFW